MKPFTFLLTVAALCFCATPFARPAGELPAAARNRPANANTPAAVAASQDKLRSPVYDNDEATRKWAADAPARIEQHRKADVRVTVTRGGKPVPGAKVEVAMRRHEFLFGCNIFKWEGNKTPAENAAYARQFDALFNFATLGFYWATYEHRKGDTKGSRAHAEKVAAWCASHGILAKGHTLAWNYYDPGWAKTVDDSELYDRQMNRIGECITQFRGKIGVWDVINETTEWDKDDFRKRGPRTTRNMARQGVVQYIKNCFAAARRAAAASPNPPLLLINDYETTDAYARLLDQLNGPDGKPIYDAIGIQSHTHSAMWDDAKIREICDRLARFGKPIHFTELTVLSTREKFSWTQHKPLGPTTPDGELWQRDNAVRIYTLLFSHPAVGAITWWDFSDQGAWMNGPAGLLRKDMTPKPAYDALKKLITEDWATNTTLKTDARGTARLRAFRGDYELRVTLPGQTAPVTRVFPTTVRKPAVPGVPVEIRLALD